MTKLKFKKSIISLLVGLIFCFCSLPLSAFGSLKTANATIKDVYETPTEVDVNGAFKTSGSSIPTKWSLNTKYSNENNNSTSYNGVISTSLTTWKDEYEDIYEDITAIIDASLTSDFASSEDRLAIINEILAANPKTNSPLVHDYIANETKDFDVLMLQAGTSYNPAISGSSVQLTPEQRRAFVEYTSNTFTLDAYSFYKVTVWAKTENGGVANITLGGDIEDVKFSSSAVTTTSTPVEYHFYTYYSGPSSFVEFVSTTAPSSSTIEYKNVTYTYDANEQAFLPPAGSEASATKITYSQKSETASITDWVKYEVYVSTVNEMEATIALALGAEDAMSEGTAYFDDVKVEKIQLLDFTTAVASQTTKIYDEREILTTIPNSRNYKTLQGFESGFDWYIAPNDNGNKYVGLSTEIEQNETDIMETFQDFDSDNYNEVFKVDNYSTKAVKINTPEFTIERFGYYRVSFWALSENKDASMTVTLTSHANGKDVTATDKTSPYTKSRTNTGSTSITNYWVEYAFFIKANPLYDTEGTFTIEISKNTIVYFDNLVIEKVTREDYDNTKKTILDLSKTTLSDTITNGRFNNYDSVDYEHYNLPLPPSSWSSIKKQDVYTYYSNVANKDFDKAYFDDDAKLVFSSDKKVITYNEKDYVQSSDPNVYNYISEGKTSEKIVKVADAEFAYKPSKSGFYNKTYDLTITSDIVAGIISGYNNPQISPNGYTENALKIYAPSEQTFTYKSSAIKFESNSVLYSVYVDVLTEATAKASVKLVDDKGKVFGELNNINTNNTWETYTIYVASGLEAKSLHLELSLSESSGTIYFKKAIYKKATSTALLDDKLTLSPTELRERNLAIVDLSKDNFIEHSENINGSTNLYDTLLYTQNTIEGKPSGFYGILDTENSHSDYSTIKPKDAEKSSYVLVIKNTSGQSTSIKTLKTITTAKSSSTKITIVAKTIGLEEGKSAVIRFNGVDASFNINSSEYQEYVLYIDNSQSTTALTIDYTIELLDSAGTVVIDSITFAKESSIETAKSNNSGADKNLVKFVTTAEAKDEKAEDETKKEAEKENNTLEILMAIISSLLLVAAIVFALVITRMKAIKKPRKVAKTNKVKSSSNDEQKGFI